MLVRVPDLHKDEVALPYLRQRRIPADAEEHVRILLVRGHLFAGSSGVLDVIVAVMLTAPIDVVDRAAAAPVPLIVPDPAGDCRVG
ncbi:hypothetical protein Vlu01_20890 [Micromonospora lutea]|uniref:Uncharacterized protein n=1 Tax=Micromonospora lutea TaxID=419825 RepID=A0ABQ4IU62_9ACTN|nr:hypothetical protein Vlu01_20890 [Micromonospora lutea]